MSDQPRGIGTLAGRHVLVTGGARGIGAAIARAVTAAGAQVTIADVDLDRAEATAAELGATATTLDVRNAADWERLVASLPPVDVLINNAGIMLLGAFLDEDDAATGRQVDVNLLGVINGCKAVAPGMVARGRGHVVNIASQAGKMAVSGGTTYSATKFAVVGLTYGLDDELRDTGVAVTCVLPGIVDTELSAGLPSTPFAPRVSPDAIAAAVLDALRRPRRQVWLPRSGVLTTLAVRVFPPRVRAAATARFGLSDPLRPPEHTRSAYEQRARGS